MAFVGQCYWQLCKQGCELILLPLAGLNFIQGCLFCFYWQDICVSIHIKLTGFCQQSTYSCGIWKREYGGGHFFFRTQSIIAEIHFAVYSHGHKGFCIMTCLHLFVSSMFYKTRDMTSCDIEFSLESLILQRIYRIPCTETAPCWSIVKTRNNTAKVQPYFFIYFPVHTTLTGMRSSIKHFFSQMNCASNKHIGIFPKWSRTFIEFRESDKSLKH